ncbi:MAG TPA: anthranilate synthase component I [Terriglobales bacterium]|nr:anthranilate synthase component I [Terriglobales bacterium]
MSSSNFKEFERLAAGHTLVPVTRTIAADLLTPVAAFLALARKKEDEAFLLESVEGGEKVGRYTFLGTRPYMKFSSQAGEVMISRGKKKEKRRGRLFDELKKLFAGHRPAQVAGLPPFTSGAVGYFSYDAVRQLERIPSKTKDDLQVPDCHLMFFDRVLAFDHVRHEITIVATVDVSSGDLRKAHARALRGLDEIENALRKGPGKQAKLRRPTGGLKIKQTTSKSQYLRAVEQAKEYIYAGDVFQVVLSQRMELTPGVAPLEIYRALRRVNPSPYMYYLRMGKMDVLGSSPEMLVKVRGKKLEYRPIAGTRRRGRDEEEDLRLEAELRADAKERAEHIMLVDLGRNDLGRVSEIGSVEVKELMFVERYSHVMHLVSALQGKLRAGLHPLDAFAACFPAGTLTGAPKVRAMEIIEELEPVRRGLYGGAIFYADFSGNLDSCIAIRTMLMQGKNAYVQAGAGIVADSVAEAEHEECLNKGMALVRAVGKARKAVASC